MSDVDKLGKLDNKADKKTDGWRETSGLTEVPRTGGRAMDGFEAGAADGELEQALRDFRSSVHAWSEAAYSRPRGMSQEVKRRSWRLALGWALGCLLVTGSVSGGLVERHDKVEQARMAAAKLAAVHESELKAQQAQAKITDEVLLAGVDSDVSQQVPSALEPLEQMMNDDETK